jgi:hypothetical protein
VAVITLVTDPISHNMSGSVPADDTTRVPDAAVTATTTLRSRNGAAASVTTRSSSSTQCTLSRHPKGSEPAKSDPTAAGAQDQRRNGERSGEAAVELLLADPPPMAPQPMIRHSRLVRRDSQWRADGEPHPPTDVRRWRRRSFP